MAPRRFVEEREIRIALDLGVRIVEGQISRSAAIQCLIDDHGFKKRTATSYLDIYSGLTTGKYSKSTVSAQGVRMVLADIGETGDEQLRRALDGLQQKIAYEEAMEPKGQVKGLRRVLAEFKGVLTLKDQSGAPGPVLPFVLGKLYSRSDVFKVLNLKPEPVGGSWFTGYAEYEGNCFIFCNVGAPGRTGHDYDNHFEGDRLVWFGKGPSKLVHSSIQRLLAPESHVYIFYRFGDRDSFTFAGIARPHQVFDTTPVKVVWNFYSPTSLHIAGEQATSQVDPWTVVEGTVKTVTTKVYERDRGARLKCIGRWGWRCFVCDFDFAVVYGELGEGFIHVHHLKPLAEVGGAYVLDPVADLRPVCPNCHSMLHRTIPALSIEELRRRMLGLSS